MLHPQEVCLMLTVLPEVVVEGVGGVRDGGFGVRHPRPESFDGVLAEGLVRFFLVSDEGWQRLSDVVLLALEGTEVRSVLRGWGVERTQNKRNETVVCHTHYSSLHTALLWERRNTCCKRVMPRAIYSCTTRAICRCVHLD